MNKSTVKDTTLAQLFSIACVWFSTHVGGGFATGNQTWQFFASTGLIGVFTAVTSMFLLSLILRQAIIMARSQNIVSYAAFFKHLWNPYPKMAYSFELFYYIIMIVAVGVAISGAASLFEGIMPYVAAVLMTGALLFVLTIFGAKLLARAATVMSIVIMVACALIFAIGLLAQAKGFSHLMSNVDLPRGLSTPIITIFVYLGFQAVCLPSVIACSTEINSWKSVNTFTLLGFLANGVYLGLGVLLLLVWKADIDFTGISLPNITVCRAIGYEWLYWCYFVTLFLAFISTGVTCIFGLVTRLENSIMKNASGIFSNITARRALISAAAMSVSMSVSMAGLSNLVRYGYGLCGYLSIVTVIIPIAVIGVIKNRRYIKEHPEFFSGKA